MTENLRIFAGITPEVAYHLEAQAIVVNRAQQEGRLISRLEIFRSMKIVKDLGLSWYLLNGDTKLLSEDCNRVLIESLSSGDTFIVVTGRDTNPAIAFGREERPVAAVLWGNDPLYVSPGFNLNSYRLKMFGYIPLQSR